MHGNGSKDEIKLSDTKKALISVASGAGAGILCTILCAPFDVAKVRVQIQGSLKMHKYSGGVLSIMKGIYVEEGARGLFKGLGPALLTVPLFWGVYWPMYEGMKSYCLQQFPDHHAHYAHFTAAVVAGVVGDVITNPFWMTRTRIQTLILHQERHLSTNISTFEMMKTIYRQEGFLAFYQGLTASFLGLSHVAIQFPLYEYLKSIARNRRPDRKETVMDLIVSSIAAKLVASSITYPHEVLRARLQDSGLQHSTTMTTTSSASFTIGSWKFVPQMRLWRLIKQIVREEGVLALWSGLRVNIIRIIPATCTTFVSYEYISRYITAQYSARR